jgi:hypothetical protein
MAVFPSLLLRHHRAGQRVQTQQRFTPRANKVASALRGVGNRQRTWLPNLRKRVNM